MNEEMQYLDKKLNTKKGHRIFLEIYPDKHVKYSHYYKTFKENFNFKFSSPDADVCRTCEELENKIKNPNLNERAKKWQCRTYCPQKTEQKIYSLLKVSTHKCNTNVMAFVLSFYCMQTILIPHIPVQETFHLCQLTLKLFEIHNRRDNTRMFSIRYKGLTTKYVRFFSIISIPQFLLKQTKSICSVTTAYGKIKTIS